jgi:hypothetical protein
MVLKDIMKLFFQHGVTEIPVMSPSGQNILGLVRKEKMVEMNTSNAAFNLTFEESLPSLIQPADQVDTSTIFSSLPTSGQIPILYPSGELAKYDTKPNIIYMLRKKDPDTSQVQENPPAPATVTRPKGEEDLSILERVMAPILVTNPNRVIQYANQCFLIKFDMEKDFLKNQKVDNIFFKLKIENGLEGTFSYGNSKWFYQVNFDIDRIFIVFSQIREVTQNSAIVDADKLIKGKASYKELVENYENGLIRKVWQKTKGNMKQASQYLGMDEKSLSYRLNQLK